VHEKQSAVLGGVVAEDDADAPPTQQPRQPLLAVSQRQPAKVLTVELQKVEGVQHGLAGGAAAVERIEDRDAIRTAYHRLAVERERPGAQGRGDGDRRVADAPVIAAAGEQAHLVADAASYAGIWVTTFD
jgi:hypothetical protein